MRSQKLPIFLKTFTFGFNLKAYKVYIKNLNWFTHLFCFRSYRSIETVIKFLKLDKSNFPTKVPDKKQLKSKI